MSFGLIRISDFKPSTGERQNYVYNVPPKSDKILQKELVEAQTAFDVELKAAFDKIHSDANKKLVAIPPRIENGQVILGKIFFEQQDSSSCSLL